MRRHIDKTLAICGTRIVLRRSWVVSVFCILLFCAAGGALESAHALDADRLITQYAHTAWRMHEGAFAGAPTVVTQTADGYLWIGTNAGLLRFDGVRFVPFSPPDGQHLQSPEIFSLLAARDGSLWIGTGTAVEHWSQGRLTAYTSILGRINAIVEDGDGAIWIARARVPDDSGPICRIIPGPERCFGKADGIPSRVATALLKGDGHFWIASTTNLTRWTPSAYRTYPVAAAASDRVLTGIEALAAARDGSLWAGFMKTGPGLGLQRFVDGAWQTLELQGLSSAALPVTALFVDREDSLWVGTVDRGVYRVRSGRVDHYDSADGLSSDGVLSFFQDREGSIWVATDRGLDKFRNMHVASYSRREGLSSNSVATVVAAQDGTLWIGNLNSLDRLRQGRVHSIRAGSGLPGTQVTSLFEDRERRLWVGLDTGVAVLEQGRFRLITGTGSRAMGTIVGITQDREGDIWLLAVAEPTKLVRIHDLQVQEEIAAPDIPRTRRMVADPRGGLWLGLTNGDLAHYMNGRVQIVPFGLPRHAAAIHALITTPDNAVLAATSSGVIASRGGAPYTLSTRNGLPCDRISSLIFDRSGALWLYAACGLISIPADELAKWWAQPGARVRFKWLDASDGVQHAITPFQPAAARSPDGRLWFASESVLQTVDPERLDLNTLAPPVHIDAVVADRRDYAANDGVRFQPRTRDIEIKYTALSFAVPEKVLFRYRLEGHDDEWHEAGTRRHAFYTDLPPGDYRFQVIASNNDGVWNETGASLRFSIEPTFYQTRTFAILCCAAVIGGVWLLISLRVRQVAKRMQMRLEERLFERERIARELHDTLLQGMLSASLQLSVANSQIAANAPAKPLVERILQLLRQAIDEGRNALHDLRERHAGPGELERAFAQIPQDLGTEDTISYRLIVEGTPRPLRPLVRDEVYRIGREALANAFRHSAASLIEAVLEFDRQHFRLVVRDDGCGIDPEVVRSGREGHWGLSGMRERSEKIGAEIKVRSGAAAGTEIELIIPAVTAFEGRGERRSTDWFARLRGEKRRDECSDSHTRGR